MGRTGLEAFLPGMRSRRGAPLTPARPHRAYPPCQRSLGIEGERVGETSFRVRRGVGRALGHLPHLELHGLATGCSQDTGVHPG